MQLKATQPDGEVMLRKKTGTKVRPETRAEVLNRMIELLASRERQVAYLAATSFTRASGLFEARNA
jgi:hypothetical protein